MVCACASREFSRSSLTAEVRDVRTWPDVRDVIEEGGEGADHSFWFDVES